MAITRAQIARELYIKGGVVNPDGRRGFGGGADFGQVEDSKGRSNKDLSGPDKGGYQGGPKGGYGDAGSNDRPSKEVREKEKAKYEKQFYDKGQVPPLGSRPTSIKTKVDQFNKQKRLDYVRNLIENRKDKIRKGLIQYQDKVGQIQGLTDFDTLQDYIDQVQSVDDLVASGFYSKDGKFSKGAIPDFTTKTGFPQYDLLGNIFGGPVTKERLNELMGEIKTLEGLQTTKGLESTNFNKLMETYQPNRFKLENPEPGGGDNQITDPCKGPNPPAYCFAKTPVTPDPVDPRTNFYGLSPRIAGSMFDFSGFSDGGRAGMMDGGMMDDTPEGGIMDLESGRQMYFLGKLVKKVTRSVKKIAKSPIGKAAIGAALFKFGGGGGLGKFFGKGSLNPFLAKSIGGDTMFSGLGSILSKAGLVSKAGLPTFTGGLALSSILPFLDKQEEDGFDLEQYYKTGETSDDVVPYNRIAGSEFDFYGSPKKDGGLMRLGFDKGGKDLSTDANYKGWKKLYEKNPDVAAMNDNHQQYLNFYERDKTKQAEGSKEPVAKKTMPLLDMGGMEKDYREDGGFVPIGRMERADDVPARLSKNEFVFTADAVRNAGEGDIDKGAEVMYNMMKNLESGGEVSEESQGLDGAREMFQTSQRLGEVI